MVIAFTADFDGGTCPECKEVIKKGDRITYVESTGYRRPKHVDCVSHMDCDTAEEDSGERIVDWLAPIDDRTALMELEEARVAPLQRPVCPTCWLELPKSLVCGTC